MVYNVKKKLTVYFTLEVVWNRWLYSYFNLINDCNWRCISLRRSYITTQFDYFRFTFLTSGVRCMSGLENMFHWSDASWLYDWPVSCGTRVMTIQISQSTRSALFCVSTVRFRSNWNSTFFIYALGLQSYVECWCPLSPEWFGINDIFQIVSLI